MTHTAEFKLALRTAMFESVVRTNRHIYQTCRRLGIYPNFISTYDAKPAREEYINALVEASKSIPNNKEMVAIAERQIALK